MTNQPVANTERDRLAEKEWSDYQEHIRIGGRALHFRSIFGLGFDARNAEVERLIESHRDMLKLEQERCRSYDALKQQLDGSCLQIKLAAKTIRDFEAQNKRLREALEKIASCEPVIDGDCPSIARLALNGDRE